MSEPTENFDLRKALIEKRDQIPPPNNNPIQTILANEMLEILDQYEQGRIGKQEYRRRMRLLKYRAVDFRNGRTKPYEYTGLGPLIERAIVYFG